MLILKKLFTSLVLVLIMAIGYYYFSPPTDSEEWIQSHASSLVNLLESKKTSLIEVFFTNQKTDSNLYLVTKIIDGDTIEVKINGEKKRVRYIGIDTPETVHPSKPVECFGKEASNRNKELVKGKMIRLEKDVSETDKYGRLLRYVYIDDDFINLRLVAEGYANVVTYPPDVKYSEQFLKAEQEARKSDLGLWNKENGCQN